MCELSERSKPVYLRAQNACHTYAGTKERTIQRVATKFLEAKVQHVPTTTDELENFIALSSKCKVSDARDLRAALVEHSISTHDTPVLCQRPLTHGESFGSVSRSIPSVS